MNVIVSNKYQALLGTLNIDVIKTINGEFTVQDLVSQFTNFFYNKMIIDITAIKNYDNIQTMRELSINFDMDKIIILLDDSPKVNSPQFLSQLVSIGIYNFTRSIDSIPFLIQTSNTYKDVANYQSLDVSPVKTDFNREEVANVRIEQRIIGFKNVTEHAGATLNDGDESLCTEIIYLIEPGIIKLNKLIRNDRKIFDRLRNKKIVLNRSILNSNDVSDFEYESGSKVFFNIPCLDEKLDTNKKINEFLIALGFSRLNDETDKNGNR